MFRRITRLPVVLVGLVAAFVTLTACGGAQGDPFSSGGSSGDKIVVGSANFPESELLMDMYAQALDAAGIATETRPNIGAREIYMEAFKSGDIDLLPEYSGALLAYLMPHGIPAGVSDPKKVYGALQDALPQGSQTLPQSQAEDKDTLTVTQATADKYHLTTIADLKSVAHDMKVGAAPEWQERFQGLIGLDKVYGVKFDEFKPLDAGGPLTIAALKDGTIDAGNIYSTDSSIATNHFVALQDPKNLFLAENIVPLIKSAKVTPKVEHAINSVSEALTTENLTAAMARVQVDKVDPKVVAADFLKDHGLV